LVSWLKVPEPEDTMPEGRMQKIRRGLRNAFSLESPHGPLTSEDRELLARIARKVVARQMAAPAILFLGSVRPLNSISSQAMVFLRPFLSGLLNPADYDRMTEIMDRREGIGALMDAIEAEQALAEDRIK
jgi:hypothetical protein